MFYKYDNLIQTILSYLSCKIKITTDYSYSISQYY